MTTTGADQAVEPDRISGAASDGYGVELPQLDQLGLIVSFDWTATSGNGNSATSGGRGSRSKPHAGNHRRRSDDRGRHLLREP